MVIVRRTAGAAAADAARLIAETLRRTPSAVLGLPTGKTAVPFYAALVRLHRRGLSFNSATTFNLDEFLGMGPHAPQSFHRFLQRHFFQHVDLEAARRHALNGAPIDWRREVSRYDRALTAARGLELTVRRQ